MVKTEFATAALSLTPNVKASLTTLVGIKNVTVTIARNATKICVCRYKRVIRAIDSKGTCLEPRVED